MSYILILLEENDFDDGVLAPWVAYNDGVRGDVVEAGGNVYVITYSGVDNQWLANTHQIAVHRDITGLAGGYAGKCRLYEFHMNGASLVHGAADPWGSQAGIVGVHLGAEILNRNWLLGWYTKMLSQGPPAVWANYCCLWSLEAGFSYSIRWEGVGPYGYDARFRAYVNDTAGAFVIEQDSFSLPAAHIAFYVSTDAGLTYTRIYSGLINYIATNIEWVGIFACSRDTGTPACLVCGGSAVLDHFAAYDLTTVTDNDPPYVANQDPVPGGNLSTTLSPIAFDIVDDGEGLGIATVVIRMDGVIVWENDAPAGGWTGAKSPVANGYRYELTPTVPQWNEIVVRATADDIVLPIPNSCDESWSIFAPSFEHNWSYEIPDAVAGESNALNWLLDPSSGAGTDLTGGAETITLFDSATEGIEDFNESWSSCGTSQETFDPADLTAAPAGGGKENFESGFLHNESAQERVIDYTLCYNSDGVQQETFPPASWGADKTHATTLSAAQFDGEDKEDFEDGYSWGGFPASTDYEPDPGMIIYFYFAFPAQQESFEINWSTHLVY